MYIRNLNSEVRNGQATITLNYDEIRCICNSLFRLSTVENVEKESNFDKVRAGFITLFALVKHGMIPDFELQTMYNLICKQGPETEKGGNSNE